MNKDQFQNQYPQLKSKIKEKWTKLTDADLAQINGSSDKCIACIQKCYNCSKEQAEEQFNSWKVETREKARIS